MNNMIPISKFVADQRTYDLCMSVLESGRLSAGPMVEHFEELVADISGCEYAVAVNNGTTALEAMLRAVDVKNKIVVTSPLTFRATGQAIRHAGGTPIFADVDEDTLNLKSSAYGDYMVPVDLYGRKNDHTGKNVFCDAAQSIGLDHSGSRCASISFYTGKNVGAGEGGAIVTNDRNIAEKIRLWRNQGMAAQYEFVSGQGWNWRMTEMSAAIAIPQLERIKEDNALRSRIAWVYDCEFRKVDHLTIPSWDDKNMVWHQYTLRHPKRNIIVRRLNEEGIEARIYYPRLISPEHAWDQTPVAFKATQEIFSIPVHHHLTSDEVKYITETLLKVVKEVEA